MEIKQRRRKHKRLPANENPLKSKKISQRWVASSLDEEKTFSDNVVTGFMGLEEIEDYNEEEIKDLISEEARKKKKKKVVNEENDENSEQDMETVTISAEGSKAAEKTEIVNKANIAGPKKLTKKERRKAKRKESFKLLLKERRKKRKELKRQEKAQTQNSVNTEKNEEQQHVDCRDGDDVEMGDWEGLGVPEEIVKALLEKNFTNPTPIQKETLPHAINHHKDIIGAAETGSGKTLAFGLPLLKHIMDLKERRKRNFAQPSDADDKPLYALILTPTRELALQINDHIKAAAKYVDIDTAVVVGGLATPKQERLLGKCPEIVIGTPGRLHKLITDGEQHLNKIRTLKFLVIDECDRMLEYGHFKELNEILDMVESSASKRQTFLFSATLTLPQHHHGFKKKKNHKDNESELQTLINKVGLNPKAKVFDLTTKHVTATMLQQLKVMCINDEKENYLLYFLMTHPGRTIVFVNSIALTKRLCSLLTLLGREPLQLHAGKQQRQRLKYLDRFVSDEMGLLIATDVAARGLDIPKVQNVVHYQLPVDPKVYIHRAGRTARANERGLSFILEGPEDFNAYKKISQVLKLGKDIPSLNVDRGFLDGIKARVSLAKQIDKEEYKYRKENADQKWMDRVAESMEIEVDHEPKSELTKQQQTVLKQKRKELDMLLKTKLIPKGFSGAYPTRGGNLMSLQSLL